MPLLELVATYLPLLLMALLALGTWWLVRSTPMGGLPEAQTPPRHEPDYEMMQFSVQRFAPDGNLQMQIDGDQGRHYPDTDTLEIDSPRVRAIAADGRITRAWARRALSNGDASDVQLSGDAHVVREATTTEQAIEFSSDFLEILKNIEQVRSHLPVTLTQGSTKVHAAGMAYDNRTRIVTLQGHMQAVFMPPASRSRGSSSPR